MKQAELIPGIAKVISKKKKEAKFAKYKQQVLICRLCGGERLSNSKREWSTKEPEMCYCVKHNLFLDPDFEANEMRLAKDEWPIMCDGKAWRTKNG